MSPYVISPVVQGIDGIPLDDSLDFKEALEVGDLKGADHKENS